MPDMNNYDTYTIYTGSYYESPDYCGDESDYYEIGIESAVFTGTLQDAKAKAKELVAERNEDYERNLVSVYSWVYNSKKERV